MVVLEEKMLEDKTVDSSMPNTMHGKSSLLVTRQSDKSTTNGILNFTLLKIQTNSQLEKKKMTSTLHFNLMDLALLPPFP